MLSYVQVLIVELTDAWGMAAVLKIWPGEPGTEAPILAYWACSISNAIGPACGMLALKYISYPAQVLQINKNLYFHLLTRTENNHALTRLWHVEVGNVQLFTGAGKVFEDDSRYQLNSIMKAQLTSILLKWG